jgi:glutamine synthetase
VSAAQLLALVCCDLGGVVRGRAVLAAELDAHAAAGVGWVPANHSLTPHGPLAEHTPFDSVGDLRLLPDLATHVRVERSPAGASAAERGPARTGGLESAAGAEGSPLELVLCDIVETDGRPWECCPRSFLRDALAALERECGARVEASFEHECQLVDDAPAAAPFSLEALRRAEPFPAEAMDALVEAGVQPERVFAEFAPHQFEVPVQAAAGLAAADRAVVLREVVREVARRRGRRVTFAPLVDPDGPGNGVHVHLRLTGPAGEPLLHDGTGGAGSGHLSELGGRFAAGLLRHARALTAVCAPSPVSAARLRPHRWSAGAVCVGERNREALVRIPPVVALSPVDPARQLRLEYRGADGAANPYLVLGALVRAGLEGVRAGLAAPPILDRDPASLDPAEAARFGVGALPGSLEEALEALAADDVARGWWSATTYEAYVGVKRAECDAVAGLDLGAVCRRYAELY